MPVIVRYVQAYLNCRLACKIVSDLARQGRTYWPPDKSDPGNMLASWLISL